MLDLKLSIKLFTVLTITILIVMGSFVGLRYHLLSLELERQMLERIEETAQRISESIEPSIWNLHQKSTDRILTPEQAASILDAEMASELIISVNVYGNFGHLFLGRIKQPDGHITNADTRLKPPVNSAQDGRLMRPIKHGNMTIGSVEIYFDSSPTKQTLLHALYIELIQIAVVSLLIVALLYWALRQALIMPINKLQVAQLAISSLNEGVVIIDKDYRILEANNAYLKLTGHSAEDLVGQLPQIKRPSFSDNHFWQHVTHDSEWSGEVEVTRSDGTSFPGWLNLTQSRHKNKHLGHVCVVIDNTEKKAAEEQLHHMAYYDPLTGLPNRSHFHEALERELHLAKRHHKKVGLLFIDLDNFKWINDTYGHTVGDQYLIKVAELFRQRVRQSDEIFRLGGDEFTAIAVGIEDEESLSILAQDLITAARSLTEVNGKKINVSASIGVSIFPLDGADTAILIKQADTAMYQAKENGRNQTCFFSTELENKRKLHIDLERELKAALENKEFELFYQPKLHIEKDPGHTGGQGFSLYAAQGAECLIRWHHPERGLVSPINFIPAAEKSQLIVEISHWVLRTACAQLQRWQNTPWADLRLAVNISPRHLQSEYLIDEVRDCIHEFDVDPKLLELEITESAIIEDVEKSIWILKQLKKLGVKIAMDDFGTGFSSLSYLKQLPIDTLKIDRSFINDLPDDEDDIVIVTAILSMANAMGMDVIAEGIEKREQLDYLLSQGCNLSQGFYHSCPLPLAEFEQWLAQAQQPLPRTSPNPGSIDSTKH